MRRPVYGVVAAAAVLALLAGPGFAHGPALHNEPHKAKIFRADLVTAYQECLVPNDSTTDPLLPLPACSPTTARDPHIAFAPKGKGKLIAKVVGTESTQDVKVIAVLSGLSSTSVGHELCPVATFRVTTDDCTSASATGCTVIDLVDFPLAAPGDPLCCTVDVLGSCKINSTLKTGSSLPVSGALIDGYFAGIEIRGCGLAHAEVGGDVAFSCGLLFP